MRRLPYVVLGTVLGGALSTLFWLPVYINKYKEPTDNFEGILNSPAIEQPKSYKEICKCYEEMVNEQIKFNKDLTEKLKKMEEDAKEIMYNQEKSGARFEDEVEKTSSQ